MKKFILREQVASVKLILFLKSIANWFVESIAKIESQ